MDEKCVLICDENYENTTSKTSDEFVCTPKECANRTPWVNGSCSLKEDFMSESGGEGMVECYLERRGGDDDENGVGMDSCVEKDKCPSGSPGVCCINLNIQFLFSFVG
jgi:hypothetical protein